MERHMTKMAVAYWKMFFYFLCSLFLLTNTNCRGGFIDEPPPEIIDVTPMDESIKIAWTPRTYHKIEKSFILWSEKIVEAPDFLGYNIYCYTDSLVYYYQDQDSLSSYLVNSEPYKQDTIYTISNLTNGTKYFIHLAGIRKDVGISVLSNQVSAVPQSGFVGVRE
ncbi:MAG: fibronectin type III domain-containing protein [candidate division WOR-3 bacterium]